MQTPQPKVSLCMIVKNEETNLSACLESVKGLFDEIIIVDTGSTDRTKEIALQYGAIVADFPWIDDFSAALNKCLDLATGKWVFRWDADNRIDEENYHRLKILFAELKDEKIAFLFKERFYLDSAFPIYNASPRLFKSHPLLRWRYRVHEQITPSLKELGYRLQNSDIIIQHFGYEDPILRQKKIERNILILEKERTEITQNRELLPHVYYELSRHYRELNQPSDALPLLQYAVNNTPKNSVVYNFLFVELMRVYQALNSWENALATCKQAQALIPYSGQLLFEESQILEKLGQRDKAIERLLDLCSSNARLQIDDPSLLDIAHYNLGVYFRLQNNLKKAEKYLIAVIEHDPKIGIAWSELSGLYISQMRWAEALNACQKAKALMPEDVSAYYWESWLHLQLGNYSQAQTLLLQLIENYQSLKNSSAVINLAKIYHNLGISYYNQGDLIQAEISWSKSLRENPQFALSWITLTNLWINQAQREKLFQAIAYLETTVHYDEMAIVIKAKIFAAQGKTPEALSLLMDFIKKHDQMIWPKIIFGEIAINASQDLPYAEKCLLQVLAMDPNNSIARQLLNKIPHPH